LQQAQQQAQHQQATSQQQQQQQWGITDTTQFKCIVAESSAGEEPSPRLRRALKAMTMGH